MLLSKASTSSLKQLIYSLDVDTADYHRTHLWKYPTTPCILPPSISPRCLLCVYFTNKVLFLIAVAGSEFWVISFCIHAEVHTVSGTCVRLALSPKNFSLGKRFFSSAPKKVSRAVPVCSWRPNVSRSVKWNSCCKSKNYSCGFWCS